MILKIVLLLQRNNFKSSAQKKCAVEKSYNCNIDYNLNLYDKISYYLRKLKGVKALKKLLIQNMCFTYSDC